MAIAILGLVMLVVIPDTVKQVNTVRLEAATDEIVFQLDLMRMKSMATDQARRVKFDKTLHCYTLELETSEDFWSSIGSAIKLPHGVRLLNTETVTFKTNGMAVSAKEIRLKGHAVRVTKINISEAGGISSG